MVGGAVIVTVATVTQPTASVTFTKVVTPATLPHKEVPVCGDAPVGFGAGQATVIAPLPDPLTVADPTHTPGQLTLLLMVTVVVGPVKLLTP